MRVSWLNLHLWIPQKDVRKLIYAKLTDRDHLMVKCAHKSYLQLPFGCILELAATRHSDINVVAYCIEHCFPWSLPTIMDTILSKTRSTKVVEYIQKRYPYEYDKWRLDWK